MATYSGKDPSATSQLLKKRKLTTPTLFEDSEKQETVDAATELINNNNRGFKNYNTSELNPSDIYPSSMLSPVRVDGVGGMYGSVPVISGGQILYPAAMSNKRNKVRLEQDALEQEREGKVKELFKMGLAAPAMAPAINKFYYDEVQKRFSDVYKTLGREAATAALGDITNPITQNVLKPYVDYQDAVRASNNVQDAMKTIIEEVNKGERVMSAATKQELLDIQNGTWLDKPNPDGSSRTIKDYAKIPGRFNTYGKLDTKFKALKDSGALEQDIMETIERGITTADGKKIESLNGAQLLDVVTEKALSSPRMQALKQNIMNDPDLSPDITEADVDNRLNALARSEAHKIVSIPSKSAGYRGMTEGDKKREDEELTADKRYKELSLKLIEGDSKGYEAVAIGKPYKDGTVTRVKIIPAGTKVKIQGENRTGVSGSPIAIVTYSVKGYGGLMDERQDEIAGADKIIAQGNDWYNLNREGTTDYVPREIINEKFDVDVRFGEKDKYTPSKSGSSPAKQRTVVKTGTYNGKKVIQYSDGTVEYAQ